MTYEVSIGLLTVQCRFTVVAPQVLFLDAARPEMEQTGMGVGVGKAGQSS